MRLISADKLARNSCPFGVKKSCYNCGEVRTIKNIYTGQAISCDDIRSDFLYMIDNEKTVKAIPIEWIKRYAKKGGRIVNMLFPFEIEMMLEEWEKENE